MQSLLLTIAAVAVAVIIFIRLLLNERRRKRKQLELAAAYDRLVQRNKLFTEYSDAFANRIIGLDKRNKKLVIIDHSNETKKELCISLSHIAATSVVEVVNDKKEGIEKVYLEVKDKKDNARIRFCFYDNAQDDLRELKSLSRRAQHWKHRIDLYKYPGSYNAALEYVL